MTRPVITAQRLIAQARAEGEIVLPDDALITPAAADWLQTARVPVRKAGREPAPAAGPTVYLIGNGRDPCLQTLLPGMERQFPSLEFLSCRGDRRCLLDSLQIVCRGLAECADRRAVVVIENGAIASCVANKQAHVRAAILAQPSALRMLQRELGINLLIVETGRLSLHQSRAAIESFLTGETAIDPIVAEKLPSVDARRRGDGSGEGS